MTFEHKLKIGDLVQLNPLIPTPFNTDLLVLIKQAMPAKVIGYNGHWVVCEGILNQMGKKVHFYEKELSLIGEAEEEIP